MLGLVVLGIFIVSGFIFWLTENNWKLPVMFIISYLISIGIVFIFQIQSIYIWLLIFMGTFVLFAEIVKKKEK